jgi:DNA-binding CsgD family transcriptional regulator
LGLVVEAIPSLEWAEGKSKPAAVIYIRDAVGKSLASEVVTKQLFNLTKAETALAMELANGLSLEEAAENLNIRRNTARAHLRSIFSKTGVRRQTELVRILLNSVVALGKPKCALRAAESVVVPAPQLAPKPPGSPKRLSGFYLRRAGDEGATAGVSSCPRPLRLHYQGKSYASNSCQRFCIRDRRRRVCAITRSGPPHHRD